MLFSTELERQDSNDDADSQRFSLIDDNSHRSSTHLQLKIERT